MELIPSSHFDLGQHEPLDAFEYCGLIVSTYDVDGGMIMSTADSVPSDTERLQTMRSTASALELTASALESTASALESTNRVLASAVSRMELQLSRLRQKRGRRVIEKGECKTCQEACTLDSHSPL